MSDEKLTRDDLVLLMESYRNMITMHQTILDQISRTMSKTEDITKASDAHLQKQIEICSSLKVISNDVKDISSKLSINSNDIEEFEKKAIEQHGKVINKIHIGWIGMGTIVVALIGIVISLLKFLHMPTIP